jgi:GDP-4-dehydro-6-deoxy-D-mannose reductase
VTGASGFFGKHICKYIGRLETKINIIGTDIIETNDINCDRFIAADISDENAVNELIRQVVPGHVIHLAGTFGANYGLKTYQVNTISAIAILEAVRQYALSCAVIAVGSAAEYGKVQESRLPIEESCPCNPVTPYGLSKFLATQIALYYHRTCNLSVTIVRPFQLIGKGLTDRLAPGAFARQLEAAISGRADAIKVGNLESCRDFLGVQDAAEAIWMLCQKPAPGEIFNLCSGRSTKIADLLQMMIEACGVKVSVEVDPSRLRGNRDVSVVYGSHKKISDHCGWRPREPLQQAVQKIFT